MKLVTSDKLRHMAAYVSGGYGLAMSAMIGFLLPLRLDELGVPLDLVGVIVGAGLLAPALVSVPLGAFIDRIGARGAFLLGTGTSAAIGVLMSTVSDYRWFLVLAPAAAVASNLGWIASQSHLTALDSGSRRAVLAGRFGFFGSLGQMVGPMVAGLAAQLVGFRLGMLSITAYALLFFLVGLVLKSVSPQGGTYRGAGLGRAIAMLRIRAVRIAMILTGTRLWISYVFITFVPVYLVSREVLASEAGLLVGLAGGVAALIAPTAGWFSRRIPPDVIAVIGLACGATGLFLTPRLPVGWMLYLIPLLVGIGRGLSLPLLITIISDAVPADQRGVAFGLRATVNNVASAVAPSLVGWVITALGIVAAFSAGGAVAYLALATAVWKRKL